MSSFKFFVPFTRAHIDKSTNKMIVEGLASTTEVDLTGERMAESAIEAMAKSNLPLPFRSEHRSDWDSVLGSVTELSATPDHQLLMKAELDADHPNAHFLFGKLVTGSQLGLSIGGEVRDWGWEADPEIGRSVRTYKDIALREVSVTSHPAVQSTFLAAINKSLNTQEHPMPEQDPATTPNENEAPQVNLEPADEVIVEQTPEQPSGAEVANPATGQPPEAVSEEGLPLNPHQDAPADQPAAAPEVPATPGNHASEEQVEAQEADNQPDTQETEPEDTTDEQPEDAAGHQEAPSTEGTQPDATPESETEPTPSVTEEAHKSVEAERDTLQKSLTTAQDELVVVKQQLAERSVTLAEAQEQVTKATDELTATKAELETVKATLAKATKDAEAEKARKHLAVVSKFDMAINLNNKQAEGQDLNKAWASLITGGK